MESIRVTAILLFCVTVLLSSGCTSGEIRNNGQTSVIDSSSSATPTEKVTRYSVAVVLLAAGAYYSQYLASFLFNHN